MFKKTLLALALASATMSATAATKVTTDEALDAPFSISKQGLPATGVYELAPAADFIEVDFVASDASALTDANFLVVEISGGFWADAADITLVQSAGAMVVAVHAGKSTSTKLYLDITTSAGASEAGTVKLQALDTLVSSGSTGLSLTTYVETASGLTIDSTKSASTLVASVANQWSVKTTKLNAEINVAEDNEEFTLDFADSKTTDTLTFTYKTIADTSATPTAINVTIDGDFSGIASVAGFNINTAKTQATKLVNAGVAAYLTAADAILFTIDSGAKAAALAERDFTATVTASYTDSEAQPGTLALVAAGTYVGGWELNSTSTTINYAPFGPNTQLILNATSTFSDAASVDLTYVSPVTNKSVTLTDIGTVAASSVSKLGDIVANAIMAEENITSGKTKITVSVNAPEGKVTFFAGFKDKVDGSRMALEQVTSIEADAAAAKASSATASTQATAAATDAALNKAALVTANAAIAAVDQNAVYQAAADAAASTTGGATHAVEEMASAEAVCQLMAPVGTLSYEKSAGAAVVAGEARAPLTDNCQ